MKAIWLLILFVIPNMMVVAAPAPPRSDDPNALSIIKPTSNDSISITANTQEIFEVKGGTGEYTWKTNIGVFYETGNSTTTSIQGNSIIYKAPPCQAGCKDAVTVVDAYGHSDTTEIDVVANSDVSCSITPETYTMSTGGNVTLELKGNNKTVSWVTHDGGELYGQTGKQIIFTANAVGTYRITGTDIMDKNCSAMATITVDSNCHITPKQATIAVDETQQFSMVGTNCNDISWYTDGGFVNQAGMYKAPLTKGNYTVTAQANKAGYSEVAEIVVESACLVTPGGIHLQPNVSKNISIVSGEGPFTAVTYIGEILQQSDSVFQYTATQSIGGDDIKICCNDGLQCKNVYVYIEQMYVNLPEEVQINSKHYFEVIGGNPYYTTENSNIIFTKGGKGTYTAPAFETTDNITIYDNYSENIISRSIVVKNYISPKINPSTVYNIALGETLDFSVVGGKEPFTWNYTGSELSQNSKNASITANGSTGTYSLSVIDGTGVESEKVIIPVNLSLKISPRNYTIYKGESDITKVRFDMSGGDGACDWISDDIQISPENKRDYHVIVQPQIKDRPAGTEYTITCRDQAGKEASAIITVAKLTFDSDDNGSINSEELKEAVGYYFEEHVETTYKMDRTELFLYLENFRQ